MAPSRRCSAISTRASSRSATWVTYACSALNPASSAAACRDEVGALVAEDDALRGAQAAQLHVHRDGEAEGDDGDRGGRQRDDAHR